MSLNTNLFLMTSSYLREYKRFGRGQRDIWPIQKPSKLPVLVANTVLFSLKFSREFRMNSHKS